MVSQEVPLYLLSQSVVLLLSLHIYAIQKYLLSTYYVLAAVLGTGDPAVTKEVPIPALVNSAIPSATFFISSMPAPSPPTPQVQATSASCLDSSDTRKHKSDR